jgi:RNA polymerase-binding transcription factor DksA
MDAALERLDAGTYGVCELTGKLIPWERLEAVPWARFSLEAQKQIEQGASASPHRSAEGQSGKLRRQPMTDV